MAPAENFSSVPQLFKLGGGRRGRGQKRSEGSLMVSWEVTHQKINVIAVIIPVASTCCLASDGLLLSYTFNKIVQIPCVFIFKNILRTKP